jgi:hypothetical protein
MRRIGLILAIAALGLVGLVLWVNHQDERQRQNQLRVEIAGSRAADKALSELHNREARTREETSLSITIGLDESAVQQSIEDELRLVADLATEEARQPPIPAVIAVLKQSLQNTRDALARDRGELEATRAKLAKLRADK